MTSSENNIITFIAARAFKDQRSLISCNLQYIKNCYGCGTDNLLTLSSLEYFQYSTEEISTISAVKELMDNSLQFGEISQLEKNSLLHFLCTT